MPEPIVYNLVCNYLNYGGHMGTESTEFMWARVFESLKEAQIFAINYGSEKHSDKSKNYWWKPDWKHPWVTGPLRRNENVWVAVAGSYGFRITKQQIYKVNKKELNKAKRIVEMAEKEEEKRWEDCSSSY